MSNQGLALPKAHAPVLPLALKPPADPATLAHRKLRDGPFWQRLRAYAEVPESQFLDHRWQAKNSITNVPRLLAALQGLVDADFIRDAEEGFRHAPMPVRVSPYLLSLIDWSRPYEDPLRIQFIPLASRRLPDHPKVDLDPLHERQDMPVPGLSHRYPDKILFLPLDTCPVYCRFCTRSYAVGLDTEEVTKLQFGVDVERWRLAFEYVASRPEVEDILISGGDVSQLRDEQVTYIGEAFLAMPQVRRIRWATKMPAVMPQKLLSDTAWVDALTGIAERGRRLGKEVMIHTHFNHPDEITAITQAAAGKLFDRGITVRNQTVLIRGVNDSPAIMGVLIKRLSFINVHPYYIYVHDMVKGVEDLRTTVETGAQPGKAAPRVDRRLQHADHGGGHAGRRKARRAFLRILRPRNRNLGVRLAGGASRAILLLLRPHSLAAACGSSPLGRSVAARPHDRRGAGRGARPTMNFDEDLERAWDLLEAGDEPGARRLAEKLYGEDPGHPDVIFLQAACCRQVGAMKEALKLLEQAAQADLNWAAPEIWAAEILAEDGERLSQALQHATAALDRAEEEEEFLQAVALKAGLEIDLGKTAAACKTLAELPPLSAGANLVTRDRA
jgi:lysine 2,3-aminomutase